MPARRLFFVSRGGGSGFAPPGYTVSGPYATDEAHAATILTQLHCHTTGSDGAKTPAQAVAEYLSRGYGALAITDHNVVTSQPAGIPTAIVGNELGVGTTMQHIIALNPGAYDLSGETDPQTIIDDVRALGGEVHLAHPNWIGTSLSAATIAALTDHYGIEIHNSKVMTGLGDDPVANPGFAVAKWRSALAIRRDIWPIAVDDYHANTTFETYDVGRIRAFVASNSSANIVAALVAGRFVADVCNFDVTPGYPIRGNLGIAVECPGATRIEAWGSAGLLAAEDADSFAYGFAGDEDYVYLVAWGGYTEDWSGAVPHYWFAYDGSWSTSGGRLHVSSDGTARHYFLRRHREGDFEDQVDDVQLHDGGGLESFNYLFHALSESYYYAARIGQSADGSFNDKLTLYNVTNGSTSLIGSAAFTAAMDTAYSIKVGRSGATVRAKVWETGDTEPGWMVSAADSDWTWGASGFRANFTAEVGTLSQNGYKTYYSPVRID